MQDYQVHYDEENKQYWVGTVVRYPSGQPAFVQMVGDKYFQTKKAAEKYINRTKKEN